MASSVALTPIAQKAVCDFPNSDIEVAIAFCELVCPAFVSESNDRLVKVGRSIRSLVDLYDGSESESSSSIVEESLKSLRKECELLVSGELKVPKVPFGNTGIDMPIITLGCMRFQQEWGPRITNMNMVSSDCQENLYNILKYAIQQLGMNHIETARAYGSSELQLGVALKQLYKSKVCCREDLIIQTKVKAFPKASEFRKTLEKSMDCLQVDYLDLFAFHGMNIPEQIEYVFGKPADDETQNCYEVVEEYRKAGKIRHIGFSTHASTEMILQLINTNAFEYVNLHYHYYGSYTASGGGNDGHGNLDCIKLLHEKNMGIFIISPFDKGGMLYAPSKQLRKLTLPDMEPMTFMSNWIWNHHQVHNTAMPHIHTYTVGAGRPSDLDQPAVAAYLHMTQNDTVVLKTKQVMQRLYNQQIQTLGKGWINTWWKGLPKNDQCNSRTEHNQLIWIYNSIKAFGMYEFGKARYKSMEGNYYNDKWDNNVPIDENIAKIKENWGWTPGVPLLPNVDYTDDLKNVPIENKQRIAEAEMFVYHWCRDKSNDNNFTDKSSEDESANVNTNNHVSKKPRLTYESFGLMEETEKTEVQSNGEIPGEWRTAYDMRPWKDFPEQPRRD